MEYGTRNKVEVVLVVYKGKRQDAISLVCAD